MPDIVQQLKPSTSTVAGAFGGGALSAVLLWAAGEYAHFNPPPEIASQIGVLVSAIVGYFFSGGRSETSL
jgi:hypothetical protein